MLNLILFAAIFENETQNTEGMIDISSPHKLDNPHIFPNCFYVALLIRCNPWLFDGWHIQLVLGSECKEIFLGFSFPMFA